MNECIDSRMGRIHVCLMCCLPVKIRGLVGSYRWKIWSRSSLVLKDLLVGTELILFGGPRYFGVWRERTRLCVDGEDGIG